MLNRRVTFWATIMLLAVLALSACAPRSGQGTYEMDNDQLIIDLPALVIDITDDGSASVGNVPLHELTAVAGGIDLSFPPAIVAVMSLGNIQHIQVSNTSEGLLLLVNGAGVPSIAYDGESLSATADTLSNFGMAIPMLDQLLGIVDKVGIGVIARFPVAPGADVIPLYMEGDSSAAMAAKAAQEEYLAAVGTPARINLPVFYETDGSFSIGDMTADEWSALTSGATDALWLSPGDLALAAGMGVSELGVSTNMDGISISINGTALPTLDWSGGKASNLLHVVAQTGLMDMAMPGMGGLMGMVNDLLPVIQTAEFDLTLHFPS